MSQFNIFSTIDKEIKEFENNQLSLAKVRERGRDGRFLTRKSSSHLYNQSETLNLIDLYYNSKFEGGDKDSLGDEKLFLNIGKFRCEVASKQIDLDTKNFRFLSDDYADPFVALFIQKDFREWSKESNFAELVNQCVEAFPKYGTIVLKRVPNPEGMLQRYGLYFVPLKSLRNEQSANTLQESSFVHEDHVNMKWWEMERMKAWNISGLEPDYDKNFHIIERYGYVPVAFIKAENQEQTLPTDEGEWVNSLTVIAKGVEQSNGDKKDVVLFTKELENRPYQEVHYARHDGRWLGVGVIEDLVPNQRAKNIIVNLAKRGLQWSSKHVFKTKEDMDIVQNLVRDVQDGDLISVGQQGDIEQVDVVSRASNEYQQFLNEWERNADQKAFTYEVATGEQLASGTPFRLGVLMSNAVNSYFGLKQERLGLFFQRVMQEYMIPQFIRDMGNKERVISFFSDEPGYEVLKEAAVKYAMWNAVNLSLLSGKSVDATTIANAITPMDAINQLFFELPENYYKDAKYKFELVITGEQSDLQAKIQTLSTAVQLLPPGDPRRDKMMTRLLDLGGETWSAFNSDRPPLQAMTSVQGLGSKTPQAPNVPTGTEA